jgi:putative peptidoglycan lipid II flippase
MLSEEVQRAVSLSFEEGRRTFRNGSIFKAGAHRWRYWRAGSVNRRIFAALVTVGSLSVAVKLVAASKEVVVAHRFGIGDELDAFLIAYLLPSFAITIIAGSFNAALIPTYIQVRDQRGKQEAQKLLSGVMVWTIALLVAISALLALAASHIMPVLGSGFSPEKIALTRSLFLVLLPLLPLTGVATIGAAILNAGERFVLAALTPIITPIAVMIAVYKLGAALGVYSIATAIIAGAALECALLIRTLSRQGLSLMPRFYRVNAPTKQVMKQYAPMIAGSCIMSSTLLVDQSMATMLGPGSVSTLTYGNRIGSVVASVGAMALSTAVLPQFSRMVGIGDWIGVRHTLKTYTRLTLLVTVPTAMVFILISKPLVSLLFERGAFTASDAGQVASVQSLSILQLPVYVLGILFVRLISALKANQILMWGTVISFALNITLDWLFMKWLGVSGIALSTSAVYMGSLGYLSFMALRLLRRHMESRCA